MKRLGLLILVLWCGIIQAQNPFEEYNYNPHIATLSGGEFIEDFDNDTIVRIGSVMLNVKNNTITSFIEESVTFTEAGAEPTVMSRWFQPDPLADEFPDKSPYNFVNNNPIFFVDPEGLAAYDVWSYNVDSEQLEWVSDTGGTETQYVGVTNDEGDNLGTATVSGSDVYVTKTENSVFVSSYNPTEDLVEGYNSKTGYKYQGLDLKKRHQLKGSVFYGLILEAEANGEAEPIHSKTAYDQYVREWGTNSSFWHGAEHYFAPEGGARGVANRIGKALTARGNSALSNLVKSKGSFKSISKGSLSNASPQGVSSPVPENTRSTSIKNSWNSFLNANKGKYSGKGWVKRAAADYKKLNNL
ncbi:hypothetical protein U6A24_18215 [Aquimarina gracilis]|uniref:RHS repeat-associated core domain-containing protein n=1 Tax=Aquimarina gracilis TaxID=874422 RepID=A0ABU6A013_9FLAO|nr:hypothetical protein [Aquimarina gracilis]MEB3347416.1 hypothetical protein [Aquimarina gracilis]